jgi:hypothetical protein
VNTNLSRSILLLALACCQQQSSFANEGNSLCRNDEEVVFSCTIRSGEKTLSLCRSKLFDRKRGYMQYRFGRSSSVELEFPTDLNRSQERFKYAHYFRHQVDRHEISFKIGNNAYSVFDYYDGDVIPPSHQQGVAVLPHGRRKIIIHCNGRAEGSLGEVKESISCDKESPLNLDGCER